jgi:hypothetical protein
MTLPRRPLQSERRAARAHLARFDDTDGAYLAAVAIRRQLGSRAVLGVVLVPDPHGPSLQIDETSIRNGVVVKALADHGGHTEAAPLTPPGEV